LLIYLRFTSLITSGLNLLRIESLRALKRYPEALEAADQALNEGADKATVHYHKALTNLQSGNLINAKSEIRLATELNPNSPLIQNTKQEIEKQIMAQQADH